MDDQTVEGEEKKDRKARKVHLVLLVVEEPQDLSGFLD